MEKFVLGRKVFNISNFLLLIGAVYFFHWYEASVPAIDRVSNYLLLFILVISSYYTVFAFFHYKLQRVFRIIALMLFVFFIYGIISLMSHNTFTVAHSGTEIKTGTYIISVLRSYLPIFAFYVFTRKGYVTENSMMIWAIIYLLVSLLIFYLTRLSFLRDYDTTEITNNAGYLFVMLIPFCIVIKQRLLRYLFLLVNIACIFISVKRGAIVCGLIAAIIVLYVDIKNHQNKRFSKYVLILVFLAVGIYLIRDFYYSSSLFQRRLELTIEGNSSGRDALIDELSVYFLNDTSLGQIIFGSGADATLRIGQNYAHNDWWEILIDQGLMGLLIYAALWIELYREWRKSRGIPTVNHLLGCCISILLLRSLFSMSYSTIVFPVSLLLGYSLAKISMYNRGG